jgi:hypothetical protein
MRCSRVVGTKTRKALPDTNLAAICGSLRWSFAAPAIACVTQEKNAATPGDSSANQRIHNESCWCHFV